MDGWEQDGGFLHLPLLSARAQDKEKDYVLCVEFHRSQRTPWVFFAVQKELSGCAQLVQVSLAKGTMGYEGRQCYTLVMTTLVFGAMTASYDVV